MPKIANIKDEEYFIEERTDEGTGDVHYLIGKRDGTSEKMHAIIDRETGEIRVEDNQIIDDSVAKEIITFIKLPNGKVIRNAREIVTGEPESKNTLEFFTYLLEHADWYKEIINHEEIWICKKDCNYRIMKERLEGDFFEAWSNVYPDKTTKKYVVRLFISSEPIKELVFISCDGGRIFVTWPDIEYKEGAENAFYWDKNSIGYKVMEIIGEYYIYESIDGIAKRSGIKIVS